MCGSSGPGPMQLWQMDILGGIRLVSAVTGELREGKVVTAVDDHCRYCVSAKVVERATSRAVCLALAEALARFGCPRRSPLTMASSSPTGSASTRPQRRGAVRQDLPPQRDHPPGDRPGLTEPEREGGALSRHLPPGLHGRRRAVHLGGGGAGRGGQLRAEYNTDRPHQALDEKVPVTPAERFTPVPQQQRELVSLWLRRPWRASALLSVLSRSLRT
jgi:transposase InsO family protein